MKILLRPNFEKTDGASCTRRVIDKLRELGAVPLLDEENRGYIGGDADCIFGEFRELIRQCDALLPIGGDGTVMHAARHALLADKPVIGVNAGRLGFLTQLESGELDRLRLLVEGRYTLSRRMMLEARMTLGGQETTYLALNDIVVSRGAEESIGELVVRQGERLITRVRGDGLIFATPTGSTAYSLSAGGPVVDPEMELLLLTAICPHATFHRPFVLPGERLYQVTAGEEIRGAGFTVSVDGTKMATMTGDGPLSIQKSGSCVQLIDLGLYDFYGRLNEKLSWRR